MQILIQKECFYASSIGADSTDHFKKQLKQRYRCLYPARDSFKNILQELMAAELDAALGYEKNP